MDSKPLGGGIGAQGGSRLSELCPSLLYQPWLAHWFLSCLYLLYSLLWYSYPGPGPSYPPLTPTSRLSHTPHPTLLTPQQCCGTSFPPTVSHSASFWTPFPVNLPHLHPRPGSEEQAVEFGERCVLKCRCCRRPSVLSWGGRKEPEWGGRGDGRPARHLNTQLLVHSWLCVLRCLTQITITDLLKHSPCPTSVGPSPTQTALFPF